MHITNQCKNEKVYVQRKLRPMTMRNMQPAKQPEKDNDDNTLKICKVVKDYKKWFRF